MSWTLGVSSIPAPKVGNFQRKVIEIGASVLTLDGTTKKDIVGRKYQYIIKYEMLTQIEVTTILNEYDDNEVKAFVVSDLSINTTVHIDLTDRSYNTAGDSYREDLTLILTEESVS